MKNLLQYLELAARRFPVKTAFAGAGRTLNYRQLYDQARGIGSYLLSQGCRRQGIGVYMGQTPQAVAAFLGIIYAGCFAVPLDPAAGSDRNLALCRKLQLPVVLWDPALPELKGAAGQLRTISYHTAAFGIIDEPALKTLRREQLDMDPVYLLFTPGATGDPKGILVSHRSCLSFAEAFSGQLGLGEKTVFACCTPLHRSQSLCEILSTLKLGATTVLMDPALPEPPLAWIQLLNRQKVNTVCWPAEVLVKLCQTHALQRLRPQFLTTVVCMGPGLLPGHVQMWQGMLPQTRFFQLCPTAQTTGPCWVCRLGAQLPAQGVPVGTPLPDSSVLLPDPQGQPADTGQICILGSQLALGYYRQISAVPSSSGAARQCQVALA